MKIHIKRVLSDGSSRNFFRLSSKSYSFLIMYNPISNEKINENDSYYYIGTHLYEKGIPVPKIYFYDRREGIFWLENLGDIHLQQVVDFKKKPNRSLKWYETALEIMQKFCIDSVFGFDPAYCYDTPVYNGDFILKRELNYFYMEFLISYMKMSPNKEIKKEFMRLSEAISKIPNNFLMHRDFQSRNIMIKNKNIYLIDFQGARFGPPTYDLASLLIDPYVCMPDNAQHYLLKEYYLGIKKYMPYCWDEFVDSFWKTALCRNLQILGAFSFLSLKKKKSFFEKFIPTAISQLKKILEYIGGEFPLIKGILFG